LLLKIQTKYYIIIHDNRPNLEFLAWGHGGKRSFEKSKRQCGNHHGAEAIHTDPTQKMSHFEPINESL